MCVCVSESCDFSHCRDKLTKLQRQYTDTKKKLDENSSEVKGLQTTVHQLEGERDELLQQKMRVEGEKLNLDKTVKEYRTESESILNDYTQAMADLRATKDDRDTLQQMCTKISQELNHQKERSQLLETQRKDDQDKLSHMDEQVRGAGWRRERESVCVCV